MPGILHYAPLCVSTAYLFNQINGLKRYTPVVFGQEPGKRFKYRHYYPLDTDLHTLKRAVQKYDIRAIHAHFGHHGEQAVKLSRQLDLPLITSIRGGEASNHPQKYRLNKKKFKKVMKHGALFLPVCHHFVPLLVNLGFPKEKIRVLHGGIDVNMFSFKPRKRKKGEPLRFISVGKTAPKKGHRYLIKAFALLNQKYPNTKLVIISQPNKTKADVTEREYLEHLIQKHHLEKKVTFKFNLKEEEIVKELHRSHIFALPSITSEDGNIEGIPNAIKEAMATGMPVIATKHAGNPELVSHRKNGLLVGEKRVRELARAIEYYMKHPDKWKRYGKRARRMVENHFNFKKQIDVQENFYDELLTNSR